MEKSEVDLQTWLSENYPSTDTNTEPADNLEANTWREIRLFLSSTFIDTQAERDVIIKRVIPSINRKLVPRFIRVTPVDLRWGVLAEESKDCETIQKTCLNQLDRCRQKSERSPWFLGLRTERYGWVQNRLEKSEGFDQPERYEWIDKFKTYSKQVSITSLECIHATLPPVTMTPAPTVFFYKREITNPEEMEENLRWVFDFEYVDENAKLDPQVQYQYAKTEKARMYKEDKENLDEYMKNLPHVKYSSYNCLYEKGGARFTSKNEGRKSFGVGYVSGLSEFEEQVERDLLNAIEENFKDADTSDIPKHVFQNTQHENAIKSKASTFIGRSELFQTCYGHCASADVESNVSILHGEPGCGKSALWAAIAQQCLNEFRKAGDFVFTHAVDSCPGSNILEAMLRRLQVNLRHYRRDLGESELSEECPETIADLKGEHVKFLEESAAKYPSKKFIILIDAVNQFHENLQAWRMWWLTSQNAPSNLRVIFSTLNDENGTFVNACERCPNADKVPVEEMSYNDRQEMVAAYLERYKKKLTTVDDPFLGNQMANLLAKSKSPLYLIAATEALRKFGIFEKMKEYINQFPNSIAELFSFLLDQWSQEYGEQFTRDVTGFLCASRDGLLENEINDILSFKEFEEGISYDCSFSRLYDSVCSFLAAGGGGFLRFFHDQLKYEVKRKFLTTEIEDELHTWLVKFFLNCIQPQLCAAPSEEPPAYYEHSLHEVVYHQLKSKNKDTVDFRSTLRNIYFVRERVTNQQEDLLQHEYVIALRKSINDSEKKALKDWSKFTQLYSPYIKKFPEWSYNMAINQVPSSYVAMDTGMLPAPDVGEGYPLYWSNNSSREDAVALKYTTNECFSCSAGGHAGNLCCIGGTNKAFLYEADSGVFVHQVESKGDVLSVYLSPKYNSFMTGDNQCNLVVWSTDTGTEEWSEKIVSKRSSECRVVWIGSVGDYVACGVSGGTIALIDEEQRKITKIWSTKKWSFCYSSDPKRGLILSGHEGVVRFWSVDGDLVKTVQIGGGDPRSLNIHPLDEDMILCGYFNRVKQVKISTGELTTFETDANGKVLYDRSGERILGKDEENNILVYSVDGQLQNRLKGHTDDIRHMCLMPGTNGLLTATSDGSILYDLPTTADDAIDEDEDDEDEVKIEWCDFILGGDRFVTLNEDGKLQLWDTASCKPLVSVEGAQGATIHPDGNHIVMYGVAREMYWLNISNLATIASCNVGAVIEEDEFDQIRGVTISPNCLKCIVTSINHGAIVLDVGNVADIKHVLSYSMRGRVFSCEIHADNERVVCGSEDLHIWELSTGQRVRTLREERTLNVKILYSPDRVLYVDGDVKDATSFPVNIMDMNGVKTMTFNSKVNGTPTIRLFDNGSRLLTAECDGSLRLHDTSTGEMLYTFAQHESDGFVCLAVHPSNNIVMGGNFNSIFYILKTDRIS